MTHTTEQLEKMLAAATPGDWFFYLPESWTDGLGYIRTSADSNEICHHGDAYRPPSENIANGTLIAAAPAIAAELIAARKRIAELEAGLTFYAESHSQNPNEGPWGMSSTDYGARARAALGGTQ